MEVLILLLLILLNGVFAMSEMSVVSARKSRLAQWAEQRRPGAANALNLANHPSHFLSTIQIGITVIGVLSGAFGEATIAVQLTQYFAQWEGLKPYAEELALGIVVVGITFCALIIGELVPKRLALLNPEAIASFIARPMQFLTKLTFPVVRFLSFVTEALVKLLGSRASAAPPVTEEEIHALMEQGTEAGVFEPHEQRIVSRVFRMDEERVVGVMTPRVDVVYLDLTDSFEENRRKILENDYSRFVLCDEGIDSVVGIIYAKSLLKDTLESRPVQLRDHAIPPVYVPGSITIRELLETFKRHRQQIALVLDEYGELEGLVTMSDVMEALVGDIGGDEGAPNLDIIRRDDVSWLIDGSVSIHRLKEAIDLAEQLPGEETGIFHTIGGFAMAVLARIPRASDKFEATGYRFEVVDMDRNRVDKLLVTRIASTSRETDENA